MPDESSKSRFPATRWSLVAASQGEDTLAHSALEELCRSYWFPIYGFARGLGLSPGDAEDATQDLFQRIVDRDIMARVAPEGGRLRSYLIASLKNGVAQEHRKRSRQKRGGGAVVLSIDTKEAEGRYLDDLQDGETPEKAFQRRWVVALLDTALRRLREEYEKRDGEGGFEELSSLLVDNERGKGFREVADRLGKSEGAVRVALFRLRKRYRSIVREEILETVSDPALVEEEIEALFLAVAR